MLMAYYEELMSYPMHFLWCRAYSHKWDPYSGISEKVRSAYHFTSLRCTSCHGHRFDWEDAFGNVFDRDYDMPEGYSLSGGYTKADYKRELWRREKEANGGKRKKVSA